MYGTVLLYLLYHTTKPESKGATGAPHMQHGTIIINDNEKVESDGS